MTTSGQRTWVVVEQLDTLLSQVRDQIIPDLTARDLIRADGRSVFQRHGGTRYATRVQLSAALTYLDASTWAIKSIAVLLRISGL